MCDNGRECKAAEARGFGRAQLHRPLDDAPDATPTGPAPSSVRPGWAAVRLVAVPAELPGGLDAERSAHVGRAPAFSLVRLAADGSVEETGVLVNSGGHGAAARLLVDANVTDVVVAGIGAGMYRHLTDAGAKVWFEADTARVADAVRALAQGRVREVAEGDVHAGGHGHASGPA